MAPQATPSSAARRAPCAEGGTALLTDVEDVLAAVRPRDRGHSGLRVPIDEPLARGARTDGQFVPLRPRPRRRAGSQLGVGATNSNGY